jgi:hypothetical protein
LSRSLVALGALIVLTPVAIERRLSADSAAARYPASLQIEVAGGYDYYAFVARGCNGEILDHLPVHSQDGGASIEYRVARTPFRIGVRGGWLREDFGRAADSTLFAGLPRDRRITNAYVNPNLELDAGSGGIGVGWVAHKRAFLSTASESEGLPESPSSHENDMSFHIRIGSLERKYFLLSWMEGVPLESGGGYLRIGIGGQTPAKRLSGLVGFATGGPQEGMGPLADVAFLVTHDVALELRLHSNFAEAGGIGVGLRYRSGTR